MTVQIHFRAPEALRSGPELSRLSRFLVARGVSRLWFGVERNTAGSNTGPGSGPTRELAPGFPPGLPPSLPPGLVPGLAVSPDRVQAIEALDDVLLEAPCADWRPGAEPQEIDELGRVRDALLARGTREIFLRLIHPDPAWALRCGRLVKERIGAPLVAALDGADPVLDAISAGPLLSEGHADAVLVLPRPLEIPSEPPAHAHPHSDLQSPEERPPRAPFQANLQAAIRTARETYELDMIAGRSIARAKRILSMLGLRPKGYDLVSCPTCGRCGLDVEGLARETDARMRSLEEKLRRTGRDFERMGGITVAVMGCNVNGPGEAREADIGIAGGKNGRGTLFMKGVPVRTLPEGELVQALMDGVMALLEERIGSPDKVDS